MQAVLYLRVSTKEQMEGTSIDFQRDACLRYAEQKGLKVLKTFVEEGESAKVADRTQLRKLLEFCRVNRGKVNALVVWKVDRFARNVSDHFSVKAILAQYGVSIHSVTEPIGDWHMGKMMETMLAGWAEWDNSVRAERSTAGMKKKLEEGLWPWQPPFGYLSIRAKAHGEKKTQPDPLDPKRYALVRRVRKEFLKGIHNVASITRYAAQIGLRMSSGKKPYPQFIDKMLRNPFYAGILVNPWTREEYPGKHEALVTPEEHQKTLLILEGRSLNATPRLRSHPDFPLRGFVRCANDGHGFTGSWSTGRRSKYAYYRCSDRNCPLYRHSIRKKMLEDAFMAFLASVTPRGTYLDLFEAITLDLWEKKYREYNADAERLVKELARLEKEKLELMSGKGKLLTDEEFLGVRAKYDEEIAITRLSLNETCIEEWDIEAAITYAKQTIRNLPRLWFDLPLEQQQRFQKLVFPKSVTYSPEHGFGTAELGLIYEINRIWDGQKTTLVPPRGVEPRFTP